MVDRRRALHLLGESMREVGILLLVFAPLDSLFQVQWQGATVLSLLVLCGLLLTVFGIIIEAQEW